MDGFTAQQMSLSFDSSILVKGGHQQITCLHLTLHSASSHLTTASANLPLVRPVDSLPGCMKRSLFRVIQSLSLLCAGPKHLSRETPASSPNMSQCSVGRSCQHRDAVMSNITIKTRGYNSLLFAIMHCIVNNLMLQAHSLRTVRPLLSLLQTND